VSLGGNVLRLTFIEIYLGGPMTEESNGRTETHVIHPFLYKCCSPTKRQR